MKNILLLEEAAQFALCIYLSTWLPFPGWWYAAFFFAPDIGMLGYLVNASTGALTYNLLHHKALAVGLLALGLHFVQPYALFSGLVMLGHSAFDRVLGYGLKYPDNFHHTHLGWIGKNAGNGSEKA